MQLDVSSLVIYVSALATLMTPEDVVALANGAPSLETKTWSGSSANAASPTERPTPTGRRTAPPPERR